MFRKENDICTERDLTDGFRVYLSPLTDEISVSSIAFSSLEYKLVC